MHMTRAPQHLIPVLQSTDITKRKAADDELPQLPPVPDAIAALLCPQEARFRFSETSYYVVERWQPRRMDEMQARVVQEYLRLVEAAMQPMEKGLLLTRILALLSHFRSDPNPPEVEYAIAQDWAEDLGEFPGWVVEQAARQWRRTKKFKPQICEIREACERIAVREITLLTRLRHLIDEDEALQVPVRRRASEIASRVAARFVAAHEIC
jgi:hypothetical protein